MSPHPPSGISRDKGGGIFLWDDLAWDILRILENPGKWFRRDLKKEYKETEDAQVLADVGGTTIFFLSFLGGSDLLRQELFSIGIDIFRWHNMITQKPFSWHLMDENNFQRVVEMLHGFASDY